MTSGTMADADVFDRADDVVWRLIDDRVIVRRVLADTDDAADLTGAIAMVWLAVDEPASLDDIVDRLVAEGIEQQVAEVGEAVAQLCAAGWLRRVDHR